MHRTRRLTIVLCLILTPLTLAGCLDVFKSQAEKDSVVSTLTTQVEQQKSSIDETRAALDQIVADLQALALASATTDNATAEDLARWEADIAALQQKYAEGMDTLQGKLGEWEPLVNSLLSAKDKPTAGEALGDIANAATALLPYPFNMIALSVLGVAGGAGATKKRKDNQLESVVASLEQAMQSDGNGGWNVDKTKLVQAQQQAGVQTLVDKMLKNIEVKKVKASA